MECVYFRQQYQKMHPGQTRYFICGMEGLLTYANLLNIFQLIVLLHNQVSEAGSASIII
jgi:hypothetical protein